MAFFPSLKRHSSCPIIGHGTHAPQTRRRRLQGPVQPVTALSLSSFPKQMAQSYSPKQIRIWSLVLSYVPSSEKLKGQLHLVCKLFEKILKGKVLQGYVREINLPLLQRKRYRINFQKLLPQLNNYNKLAHLDLSSHSTYVDDRVLFMIAHCCPVLQKINLKYCKGITTLGLKAFLAMQSKPVRLKALSISYCEGISTLWFNNITLELQELDIDGCQHLRPLNFQKFIAHSSQLTSLTMSRCRQIGIGILSQLAISCGALRSLRLAYWGQLGKTVFQIEKPFNNLVELDLSGSKLLDDETLKNFVSKCPNLEWINLSNCPKITSQGIKVLATLCPKLQEVFISNCLNITKDALLHLFELPQLLALVADGATKFGVELLSLKTPCSQLKKLSFFQAPGITDEFIQKLVPFLPNLETLELTGCDINKRETVRTIYRCCLQIKRLKLSVNEEGEINDAYLENGDDEADGFISHFI